jgi:AraC family transcriptional regulator
MSEQTTTSSRRQIPGPHGASAFAKHMRASFALPSAPVLEARDLSFGPLAVTELRYDAENYGQSAPVPEQDALMVSLQLRDNFEHEVWEDGKRLPWGAVTRGMTSIFDLRGGLTARSQRPFHSLNFAVPLWSLDEVGEERRLTLALRREQRQVVSDPVIHALGISLLPALAHPEQALRLFVDHVLFALRAHLAQRFGGVPERSAARGGLAAWQERRARELLDARLTENVALAEVAQACGLSLAQFARAFKRSTGRPPHQFLIERRVERARELLRTTGLPLADVATRCGFADQSHFTKVFHRVVGTSPGSFRAAARTTRGIRA